jgi:hypothetical protein
MAIRAIEILLIIEAVPKLQFLEQLP